MSNIAMKDDKYTLHYASGVLVMDGTIDTRFPGDILGLFLKKVHEQILLEKLSVVEADVKAIRFINSSGIKEFTGWILNMDVLPPEEKYTIKFLLDPQSNWQKLTFNALKWLSTHHIELVTDQAGVDES